MSKNNAEQSRSAFTLTFVIEIVKMDVFHDCEHGWIVLGPPMQGINIKYNLYIGQTFQLDVTIWPHVAKVWCNQEYCWVRTFLYLERRWLAFSIRHAFRVKVDDFKKFEVIITPAFGVENLSSYAKNDGTPTVYIPKLEFGQSRYFGPIIDEIDSERVGLIKFIKEKILWNAVIEHIPPSCFDGMFDKPCLVSDVRHQDAAIQYILDTILCRKDEKQVEVKVEPEIIAMSTTATTGKGEGKSKMKMKEQIAPPPSERSKTTLKGTKSVFQLKLTGNEILAGVGRVVHFNCSEEPSPDVGEMAVLISTNNLPADDDSPILFVNVERVLDLPIKQLKKYHITQVYTKWQLGTEVHESYPKDIDYGNSDSKEIAIHDHHAIALDPKFATETTAIFRDDVYEIQLRGKITPPPTEPHPKFFGYDKSDKDYKFPINYSSKVLEDKEFIDDTLIAVTKIDAKHLAKGIQAFIRGEYPLYPPTPQVIFTEREAICTNDINGIRAQVRPTLIVPPFVVLASQMTLEVSMGVVGCKPPRLTACYSRLYCLVSDPASVMAILMKIKTINETECEKQRDLLTGFAIDTGDVVVLFLEGPRDGKVLHVWEQTADYYPQVKPVFSSSARYSHRIFPEMEKMPVPFLILKMFVPLPTILACPPVYAKPALPLPTKSAVLKLGRLSTSKLREMPERSELPTFSELLSFRLELCTPHRPPAMTYLDKINSSHSLKGLGFDATKEQTVLYSSKIMYSD